MLTVNLVASIAEVAGTVTQKVYVDVVLALEVAHLVDEMLRV